LGGIKGVKRKKQEVQIKWGSCAERIASQTALLGLNLVIEDAAERGLSCPRDRNNKPFRACNRCWITWMA